MQSVPVQLTYESTGYFSPIVLDYIKGAEQLKPFYDHPVSPEGIRAAIACRRQFTTDRKLLVQLLQEQYKDVDLTQQQQLYLQQLAGENTFTICTAHQPNIFTGHLYFIYKIVHAIKLADTLTKELPEYKFIPVYYMGSEDADLEELGHIYLGGKKYEWKTNQQGAVGRMKVDKALLQLIEDISGQLLVHEQGKEIVALMKRYYQLGATIEQATFKLVNELFAEYGLLILLPDRPLVKRAFIPVIKKELEQQFSHRAVQETVSAFPSQYKVQAAGRELNLFYLEEGRRGRIEVTGGQWSVAGSRSFSKDEILKELEAFPERFSPNVILRPVLQETILPNVAFIGGGGEIAYWLELKKVFEAAAVPFPVLVLRNSFLLVAAQQQELMQKLGIPVQEIFEPEAAILNRLVKKMSNHQLHLDKEKNELTELYSHIKTIASNIDNSLQLHADVLLKKALHKIEVLEKKMLKAEKHHFEAQQRQLHKLKAQLFPNNSLQERIENFMPFYARQGKAFIKMIYENSLALEQEFVVINNGLKVKDRYTDKTDKADRR